VVTSVASVDVSKSGVGACREATLLLRGFEHVMKQTTVKELLM